MPTYLTSSRPYMAPTVNDSGTQSFTHKISLFGTTKRPYSCSQNLTHLNRTRAMALFMDGN